MTCDRRTILSIPISTVNIPVHGRVRLFSTPEKKDLETIYEVKLLFIVVHLPTRLDQKAQVEADLFISHLR